MPVKQMRFLDCTKPDVLASVSGSAEATEWDSVHCLNGGKKEILGMTFGTKCFPIG